VHYAHPAYGTVVWVDMHGRGDASDPISNPIPIPTTNDATDDWPKKSMENGCPT